MAVRAIQPRPSSATALDLGAGTGKLTRLLVSKFVRVVAVEPDDEMRALVGTSDVRAGTAEAIPLEDNSVDAVFVGEAFHWFDADPAIDEIARVLRPRGGLAIVWTHWWETEPPLPEQALALLREPWERTAGQRREPWDAAFKVSPFEPLQYERAEEEITVGADTLLALYSTTSAIAALPAGDQAALLAAVRPHLDDQYRLPIKHELTWTRLRC